MGDTRVTLDTVIHTFEQGHTAEEIVSHYIVASDSLPISTEIENVRQIVECSSATEWTDQLQRLPL